MKPKLIDTSKYSEYNKLLPFVEAMKTFNIDAAIKDIKSDFQKDAENVEKEYWFHLINTNEESGYYSNWAYGDEEVPDDDDKPIGDWKYIMFQSTHVPISEKIKNIFAPYLALLDNFPHEIEIHSIQKGAVVPTHVDKPGVPVNASSNRNLVISLSYPKGVPAEKMGVHVDNIKFSPEEYPAFIFDSQYVHGAWNETDTPWIFIVLYIPTEFVDGESGEH